jgi:TolB protein
MVVVKRWISLLAVAGVCATTASAAGSPAGHVVFASSSGVGGKAQIWLMRADGSGRHAISPRTVYEDDPALSRDGRRVAFNRRGDIYVMNVDGSQVRRLTFSPATEGAAAWSPDGRWIAYSSYHSGHSSIWKMLANGGAKTRLTPPGTVDVPAWSPDGRRIAYAGPGGRLWVMNADGSGPHALTHTASGTGVDWAPSWSPDGRRLAYESDVATGPRDLTSEIWVIGSDGAHPVRLTHNQLNDTRPVWSPDGSWLVFSSPLPHPGTTHLWRMQPNGKGLRRVTSWPGEQYWPSWGR